MTMRFLSATALVLGLLGSASGQTVAEALRGPVKKLAAADLPENYRAVAFGEGLGTMGVYAFAGLIGGGERDSRASMMIDLMSATFVDPDEFAELLEGKRPRIRAYALDFAAMVADPAARTGGNSTPAPVFTETWIEGRRVLQWSPRPSLTRDALVQAFSAPPKPNLAQAKSATLSNAKQAAVGILIYAVDYDDKFPDADSTAKAQTAVAPYTKSAEVWKTLNPNGGRLLYNTSLSRVADVSIESPAETLLLWDEKPWPDGSRVVAYADGHAKSVNETEWAALWEGELRRRKAPRAIPPKARVGGPPPGFPPRF